MNSLQTISQILINRTVAIEKPFNLKNNPYCLILLLCIEQLVDSELLDQLIQQSQKY